MANATEDLNFNFYLVLTHLNQLSFLTSRHSSNFQKCHRMPSCTVPLEKRRSISRWTEKTQPERKEIGMQREMPMRSDQSTRRQDRVRQAAPNDARAEVSKRWQECSVG